MSAASIPYAIGYAEDTNCMVTCLISLCFLRLFLACNIDECDTCSDDGECHECNAGYTVNDDKDMCGKSL